MYLEAIAAGSALAAANLAFGALSSGDLPKAQEWLERGRLLDESQPNLLAAQSAVQDRQDAEKQIKAQAIAQGREVQFVMRAVDLGQTPSLPTGDWQWIGDRLTFIQDGNTSLAEGANELSILMTLEPPLIKVKVTKGKYFSKTYTGIALQTGPDAYKLWLRDWPTDGRSGVGELHRDPVTGTRI
ncbi:MAG TPA: hypothetical protein VF542_11380 [Jatrophihabitans sp.]|jgi:hypothetical protein